jgi:hypothetical protein
VEGGFFAGEGVLRERRCIVCVSGFVVCQDRVVVGGCVCEVVLLGLRSSILDLFMLMLMLMVWAGDDQGRWQVYQCPNRILGRF